MGLEDSLLAARLYSVLALIADRLGPYLLADQFASLFDEERILQERRLALVLELKGRQVVLIAERYTLQRYQHITMPCWLLMGPRSSPVITRPIILA
jgi:hypothetical protein